MDKIQDLFDKLIDIYNTNLALSATTKITSIAESITIGDNNFELWLTREQIHIKHGLIGLLLDQLDKFKLSREYIAKVLNGYTYQVLQNKLTSAQACLKIKHELQDVKLKNFTFVVPAMINLESDEPIKIIGLTLVANPIKYLRDNSSVGSQNIINTMEEHFVLPAPYLDTHPVAAIGEVKAIDLESAQYQFKTLTHEVTGLLNLLYPSRTVYFFNSKPFFSERLLYTTNYDQKSECNWGAVYSDVRNINLVTISYDHYNDKLKAYISWLSETPHNDNKGDKAKIEKMKTAFYWYGHALAEQSLTNKFIYLITVLETILKTDGETSEISTMIADRVALFLYNEKETRIEVQKIIKKIYNKRSNIIHKGLTLCIKDKQLVDYTQYYVSNILKEALEMLSDNKLSFDDFIKNVTNKKFD